MIYGVWDGGLSYADGQYPDDLERFASIEAAGEALKSRATFGHYHEQRFDYVNKPASSALTPNADDEPRMWLYRTPQSEEAFALLEIGPRGGVQRTNL